MIDLEYKIWFSKLNVSNKIRLKLLDDYKNEKNIWNCKKEDFLLNGYKEKTIDILLNSSQRVDLEKEKRILENNNIKIISKYEDIYPKRLLNIYNCPAYLYLVGNINRLYEKNIGIIGSRCATEYGKKTAMKIAIDLADYNINIVSGLAIGIDKYAHIGALKSRVGNTIAVLGTGLSKCVFYPKENLKIYEKIIENDGLIVSEYPFFESAKPYYFPERNRIISGLSDKIIVVEAGMKSGTLITVDYALDQGRDVYAVPGNIDNYNSFGTNNLIKQGAIPFLKIDDILTDYN